MVDFISANRLTNSIKAHVAKRGKLNVEAHLIAASSVLLAVKDGRCDWLNQFHAGLDKINAQAFKAWLSPTNTHWFGKELGKDHAWLKFETEGKDGKFPRGFYVAKGTEALRPTTEMVEAVADDINKAFFNTTAEQIKKNQEGFDLEGLMNRLAGVVASVEKAVDDGKIAIPARVLQSAKEMALMGSKNAVLIATVNGQPVPHDEATAVTHAVIAKRTAKKTKPVMNVTDIAATA